MLHYCKVKPNAYELVLPSELKIVLTCYGFHIALYWAYMHHVAHFKGKLNLFNVFVVKLNSFRLLFQH